MTCFEDHGRCLAYIFWIFLLAGIVADFFCQFDELEHLKMRKTPVSLIFMAISSGAPIFRVFGTHFIVKCLHVFLSLLPMGLILYLYKDVGSGIALVLWVIAGAQFLMGCFLFCCWQGHTVVSYAWRAGLHALCGIISIVYYYLICCFLIKPEGTHGSAVVEAFYILLLLTMLLTPGCQSPDQAIPRAELERREFLMELKKMRRVLAEGDVQNAGGTQAKKDKKKEKEREKEIEKERKKERENEKKKEKEKQEREKQEGKLQLKKKKQSAE